jgi:hypothetical protein
MAIALKIFAVLMLLAGGRYLYVELEAVRVGAVSPMAFLVHVLIVAALAIAAWVVARRIDRQANENAGTL